MALPALVLASALFCFSGHLIVSSFRKASPRRRSLAPQQTAPLPPPSFTPNLSPLIRPGGDAGQVTGPSHSYSALGERAYGRMGRRLVNICTLCDMFGGCAICLIMSCKQIEVRRLWRPIPWCMRSLALCCSSIPSTPPPPPLPGRASSYRGPLSGGSPPPSSRGSSASPPRCPPSSSAPSVRSHRCRCSASAAPSWSCWLSSCPRCWTRAVSTPSPPQRR